MRGADTARQDRVTGCVAFKNYFLLKHSLYTPFTNPTYNNRILFTRSAAVTDKIDYEIEEYDHYATIAQTLLDLGTTAEARAYETLADLCFEKAQMLAKLEQLRDYLRRRSSCRKRTE